MRRRIVTRRREYRVMEHRDYLNFFHPEFLRELTLEFGPKVFEKVLSYAELKEIRFEGLARPERTLINLLIKEMAWQKKQELYRRYNIDQGL